MSSLRGGIVVALLVVACLPPVAAGADFTVWQRWTQAWNERLLSGLQSDGSPSDLKSAQISGKRWRTCQVAVATLGTLAVISAGGLGHYNTAYPTGAMNNIGTASEPVWVPGFGPEIFVDERSPRFNFRAGSLWVHDGKNSFGRIDYRNQRVEFNHGKETIAYTDRINPYGRPYSAQLPIVVQVYDSQGYPLGRIEEFNEFSAGDRVEVRFRIYDAQGQWVAGTSDLVETAHAVPLQRPWRLMVHNADGRQGTSITRSGMLWNRTRVHSTEAREADGRLFVIFLAYKHLVDTKRE